MIHAKKTLKPHKSVKNNEETKEISEAKFFDKLISFSIKIFNFSKNLTITVSKWLIIYLVYFLVYNFLFNYYRISSKKNRFQKLVIKIFFSYGILIIFAILFFFYYFVSTLNIGFFTSKNDFSLVFTSNIISNMNPIWFFGLTGVFLVTALMNGFLILVFSQSLGMVIFNEKFVDSSTKHTIPFIRKLFYILFILIFLATFFVWPIFFGLIIVIIFYAITRKDNLILRFLNIKVQKEKTNIVENFTKNHIEDYQQSKLNLAKTVTNKEGNDDKVINSDINNTIIDKTKKNGVSALIFNSFPRFLNFIIYFAFSIGIFSVLHIWTLLFNNSTLLTGSLKAFFLGYRSKYLTTFWDTKILSLLNNFHNADGSSSNTFIGRNGIISFNYDSINYQIQWISHPKSWHAIWNNVEFMISCLAINLKYSPETMVAWIFLFSLMAWFFLNILFLLIFGNTIFGFIFNRNRLINSNTNLPLTIFGRALYVFFYIIWIGLFFVPFVNVLWIFINIYFIVIYQKTILNYLLSAKFSKNIYKDIEREFVINKTNKTISKFVNNYFKNNEEYYSSF